MSTGFPRTVVDFERTLRAWWHHLTAPAATRSDPVTAPDAVHDAPFAAVPAVASRLRRLWFEGTGRNGPTDAELQIALAISWLESGLGQWWKDDRARGRGDMRGSGNLGSIQCLKRDLEGTPPAYYSCVAWKDHRVDGSEYVTGFRFYRDAPGPDGSTRPAADWAALDLLRFLSAPSHPLTGAALARGGSIRDVSTQMHREHYYEGRATPEQLVALKRAKEAGNAAEQHAIEAAITAHVIDEHAHAILSHLPAVAAALGQPIAAALDAPAGVVAAGVVLGAAVEVAPLLRARRVPGEGRTIWYVTPTPRTS